MSRKPTREELERSLSLLKATFEALPDGIMFSDLDRNIVDLNEKFAQIWGTTPDAFRRLTIEERRDFLRDRLKDPEGHEARLREVHSQPEIDTFDVIETVDGRVFERITHPQRVAGKSVGRVWTYREITERKRAEEALRLNEERLRAIFEASPDPLVVYDVEGTPEYLNPEFSKVFGWRLEELQGRRIPFVPEDQKEITSEKIAELFSVQKPLQFESRRLTKGGEVVDVIVSAAAIRGPEGRNQGMVVNLTDISEQKGLEERFRRAQRMESLGTLAGGIAHNINNVLMGVQGRVSLMLMNKEASHPDAEHLRAIEEYVRGATELTRDLLGFARGGKYEVEGTDLNALIRRENEMFGRTRREIRIHEKLASDLWTVDADQGQIRQVLMNLYVNAWQAMPSGGELFVRTENVDPDEARPRSFGAAPGRYVRVVVTDTGVGMDKRTQEKVFEPFFTTREVGRGAGLGLASVYGIVKNHGGFVELQSKKGEGASFSLYFPASDEQAREERRPLAEPVVEKGEETLLLVDDERMIADVGRQMLESLGYKVHVVRSGEEAVDLYRERVGEIDGVILDMIMPGMGGGETYDRLREIDPNVKVLLSSGYSINGQASEILERGCRGFIQKPFDLRALSRKLRTLLAPT